MSGPMMRIMSTTALAAVVLAQLGGCTASGQEELREWMQTERSNIRPQVKPIPEPTKFVPQAYLGGRQVEPFSDEKLVSVLRASEASPVTNSALIAPELSRRKQPLEAYPLDTMAMVGSLDRSGQLVALIRVENLLYQVRPGQYLGQNYGRITKISETEVVLREIVQDAVGEWIERPAALQLQEEGSK